MKVFDYQCPNCQHVLENHLVDKEEEDNVVCPNCCEDAGKPTAMEKLIGGAAVFEKIIPTYPGSQRRKAGYKHKFVNRPATKTQVGVGGGVTKGDDR